MPEATARAAVTVAPADLDRVRELYAQGLCLQAYRLAETFGPLPAWTGPDARVLAGRLAIHLGAPRLAFWMHLSAFRQDRSHPEARYYYVRALLERRGPLAAWQFLRGSGDLADAPAPLRSDWLAFHGCVLGQLRDFDAAETWLAHAEEVCPGRPWTCIERAALLEWEDRYEESLAAGRRALELRPWYRPAVQCVAHTLQLLGRDREALDLLTEGAERIESVLILYQLAALQSELGHHADARRSYARALELSPLLEPDGAEWLAARRSDAAYCCGDFAEAAELARKVSGPLYGSIAEKLADPVFVPKRVLLDVGFVRQHYQTCVPATLTAISRFWKMPAEHLEVAAAICYDGTPDHRERAWAEEQGYVCREFTVTWESACALIDRGVPFTLTLVDPGNAHLQAVIGYDTCRRSLMARDPYQRHWVEYHADVLLERHRGTGPRGHALVPRAEAHRLDGLDLPDAALYDRLYQLQRALERYNRDGAADAFEALRQAAPDHRLTWQAHRILAIYDADPTEMLAAVEGLLRLYPDNPIYLLQKLSYLRDLARRDERVALLRGICLRPDADPIFHRLYAQELLPDAREHPVAARSLRRAIRLRPYDGGHFSTLAQLSWEQRRFEEALELFGFAACLDDKDEYLARNYFSAARHLRRTEETLRFLQRRFKRFGARSSQPARTLYWAYDVYERTPEGLAVLDEALTLRPDDTELMLFAAQEHGRHGDIDRAQALLARAQGRCPRAAWLRTSAHLASSRGDLPAALALWREVAALEPMAVDANAAVVRLLAETEGRPAALAYLEAVCTRFPHNYALHQLWSDWLRDVGADAQEPVVRKIIAIHPADAWARRELALVLSSQGRLDEAFAELEVARGLEPNNPSYYCVRGGLCERAGQIDEARAAYREAIRLSVDNDWAIGRLMELCDSLAQRRDALAFVESELVRQVIFGDGLLAYQQYARYTLEPEELLASLRRAHEARPDLWHAWSALIIQLIQMGRADEAYELARQATARFPLMPGLWIDLADACRARGDEAGEVEALQQAIQVRPGWAVPLRRLAEVYVRGERFAEARPLLERAVALAPLDPVTQGYYAHALWQMGEKEAALERVQTALTIDPGYDWGWDMLRQWSAEMGRREAAMQVARRLVEQRPHEARSWMVLADMLRDPAECDERLAALDRALALNPRLTDAHDQKAALLAQQGRYADAEAACQPAAFNGTPPLVLRGRRAWLEAQQGRFAEAVERMQAALAEDPDYYWGWCNMAEWLRDHGETAQYLEAGENLVRLAPTQPTSYGFRGEARMRAGDRDGAKDDFRKAFDLDPTYGFAGLFLFDYQLADDELEEADRTLALLKEHNDDAFVAAREAQLAARRGQREAARAALRRVGTITGDATWPLDAAVAALSEAGWESDAEAVLRELAFHTDEVSPQVGAKWVRLVTSRGDWDPGEQCIGLLDRGPVGREAVINYLSVLARTPQPGRIQRFVSRYGEKMRGDTALWGTVGYALAAIEKYSETVGWLADWEERADLKPWMLINLVLALRALGNDAEAARVSRRALELEPDHSAANHAVWLALDEALAGRPDAALRHLAGLDQQRFDNTHRFLSSLIEALAAVKQAPAAERGRAFAAAQARLRRAAAQCSPLVEDRPAVRRAYRQAVMRLAADVGGLAAWLWGLWRWLNPMLPAPHSAV